MSVAAEKSRSAQAALASIYDCRRCRRVLTESRRDRIGLDGEVTLGLNLGDGLGRRSHVERKGVRPGERTKEEGEERRDREALKGVNGSWVNVRSSGQGREERERSKLRPNDPLPLSFELSSASFLSTFRKTHLLNT